MLLLLADVLRSLASLPTVEIERLVALHPDGRVETVLAGAVFNRSGDRHYVLENAQNRATHVELAEDDEVLFTVVPGLKDVLLPGDIELPPGEFCLMQDIYQLPDSGSWETAVEVPVETAGVPPVCVHSIGHLHAGQLIDNPLVNQLRRRTSYIRCGSLYRRSRDTAFRVRPRPKKIVVVVDKAETRSVFETLILSSPVYEVGYYVLQEAGIDIHRLDKGAVENIGLVKHLMQNQIRPDVLLFEPHREKQRLKTETTIIEQSGRISAKFSFHGIKCGTVDAGLSPSDLQQVILRFFEEEVQEVREAADATPAPRRPSARIHRRTTAIHFDYVLLANRFLSACRAAGIAEAETETKLKEHRARSSKLVLQLVENRWIKSLLPPDRFNAMSPAEKAEAVRSYVRRFPDRVSGVRDSLLYEITLQATLALCEERFRAARGENAAAQLEQAQAQIETRVRQELLDVYRPQNQPDMPEEEFLSLHQRDHSKLVSSGLIEFYFEALGIPFN